MLTIVLYYSTDEYAQMGEQGFIDEVFKQIEIIETGFGMKFVDLNKKMVGKKTISVELIME